MSVFPTSEKTNNMLLNLILPLVIRMGCGRRGENISDWYLYVLVECSGWFIVMYVTICNMSIIMLSLDVVDCPKMRQSDINFALTIILHALMPPQKIQHNTSSKSHHLSVSDMRRSSTMSSQVKRVPRDLTQNVSFLGTPTSMCS